MIVKQNSLTHLRELVTKGHKWFKYENVFPKSSRAFIILDRHFFQEEPVWAFFLISYSTSGLNDLKQEDVYQWADGTNITITSKWIPGEPNNSGNEDCVEVKLDGMWNDMPCLRRLGFICETRLGNEKIHNFQVHISNSSEKILEMPSVSLSINKMLCLWQS